MGALQKNQFYIHMPIAKNVSNVRFYINSFFIFF